MDSFAQLDDAEVDAAHCFDMLETLRRELEHLRRDRKTLLTILPVSVELFIPLQTLSSIVADRWVTRRLTSYDEKISNYERR